MFTENAQRFANARLDTWKSIAQHLGRSTRTVQRWRSEYGLPVRHLGGDATSVFAYIDELNDWLRGRNQAEPQETVERLESNWPQDDPPLLSVLTTGARRSVVALGTSGPSGRRAAELVALAQEMWKSLSDANLCSIVRTYRIASDVDPANAEAFAGLSQTLIAAGLLGQLHTSDAYPSAQAALQRAMELDPDLVETRCSAAWLKLLVIRDWTGAGVGFDEILIERPECLPALVGRALLSLAEGRLADAADLLREASIRHPLNTAATALLCWQEYLAGNFENALAFVTQARAGGHAGAILDAVEALASVLLKGPASDIEKLTLPLQDFPRHYAQLGVHGYVYGMCGQEEKAREIIDSMTVLGIRGKCDYAYAMALTYLGLNEPRPAMEWIKESYLQGSLWSLGFRLDPILMPLRTDPRIGQWFDRTVSPVGD